MFDWHVDPLNLLSLVALVFIAADRWVHGRETTERDVLARLDAIEARIKKAAERSSEREGEWTKVIGDIQLNVRELQTILKVQGHGING